MSFLVKLISYPLSILHYFFFGLILVIFWPIQWICLKLGGYQGHKKSVDVMSFFLVGTLYLLGTRVTFRNEQNLPLDVPLIFASNHQSMHDIPALGFFLRKYHPKFVSKIELGRGIPSISFNLRHGGSVLIDRKDAKQSLGALMNFGKYLEDNKRSAVIFPEGTRSRDGVPKRFSENGLKMMIKKAPSSYVVPITINNSWRIVRFGNFPLGVFDHLTFDVHEPIKSDSMPFEELFQKVEKAVKESIIVN